MSIAGDAGDEHPASQDIIDLLKNSYRNAAQKGEYKATAIFYDVRVVPPGSDEKTDAIAVALDHQENYSVVVLFSYALTNSKGQLRLLALPDLRPKS